jgi:hypothetical protein
MNNSVTGASAKLRNTNPYLALGVRPFINCASVRTAHSGSLMLPEVRTAIDRASRHFVGLDELMEGAGRRIAELTGAPWGMVTCGSAAALTLATTACVAGNDPVKMTRGRFCVRRYSVRSLPNRTLEYRMPKPPPRPGSPLRRKNGPFWLGTGTEPVGSRRLAPNCTPRPA